MQSDSHTKSRNSVSEEESDREKREKNCESERLSAVEGVKNRLDRLADFSVSRIVSEYLKRKEGRDDFKCIYLIER